MNEVIYAAVYFTVTLGAFLLGKYVFPNIPRQSQTSWVNCQSGQQSLWNGQKSSKRTRPEKRRWQQLWSS